MKTVSPLLNTPIVLHKDKEIVNNSIEFVVQPPYDDDTLYSYAWTFTNKDFTSVNVTVASGGATLEQFFDTVGSNKGYDVVCRISDAYSSVEYYGNVRVSLLPLFAIPAIAV